MMDRDHDLELAALQAAICDWATFASLRSMNTIATLPPDAFSNEVYRRAFHLMVGCAGSGSGLHPTTLISLSESNGIPKSRMIEIVNWGANVPDIPALEFAVKRLLELRGARIAKAKASEIHAGGLAPADIRERLAEIEAALAADFDPSETRTGSEWARSITNAIDGVTVEPPPIPTGIPDLDFLLGGGMGRGHMVVVGAATAGGKTNFMCNVAANDLESGFRVGFVSQELQERDMQKRLLGILARVWMPSRLSDLKGGDLDAVAREAHTIRQWGQRWRFTERRLSISQVATFARAAAVANDGLDLLIVDHIQITPAGRDVKGDSRQRELAHIAERMSALAKELDCVVLTGSQLTESKGERSTSDNTRESKDIAHNARLVLELQNPNRQGDAMAPKNQLNIRIDKNTMGPAGGIAECLVTRGLRIEGRHE